MRLLLPLYCHPGNDPLVWDTAAGLGQNATVVVNIDNGPGVRRDAGYAATTNRLAAAGVTLLGYVDLARATRPLAAVLADVRRWIAYPVGGVFLDRAPADVLDAGPVALAIRTARRAGLPEVVVNPGSPAHPVYRDLGADLCCFEGGWADYAGWDGTGALPGDGHLVYGVPAESTAAAWQLLAARGAGFGLVTERDAAAPYAGLPAWCAAAPAGASR